MIAAIYCRKSTDQNVPDEEKSIARQLDAGGGGQRTHGYVSIGTTD